MCDMRYACNKTNRSTFIMKRKNNSGRRTEGRRDFLFWKSLASIEKSFWSSCSPLQTFHCFSSKMEWQKRYCSCLKKVESAQKVQVLVAKENNSRSCLKNEIGFTLDTLDQDHNKDR